MGDPIDMDANAAAAALAEIQARQGKVIDRLLVPNWYWWGVGLGMVVLGVAVDFGTATLVTAAAVVYGVGVAILTLGLVLGAQRGAKVSPELLGNRGTMAMLLFIWGSILVSLGTGFGLRALGFAYPATAATVVGAVAMIGGGPRLMGYLRSVMLANRTASAR